MDEEKDNRTNSKANQAVEFAQQEIEVKVDETIEPKEWSEYNEYKLDVYWEVESRQVGDCYNINSISTHFYNVIVKEGKSFKDIPEIQAFQKMQEHYLLLKEGKFSWEKEL